MFPPAQPTASFPYRIVTKVGEGGMGAVYRAQDLDLGRDVAIKVIKAEHLAALRGPAAQLAVDRFLQEARAAAALSHPGVTMVHRIGTEDGRPYIAMEWLDGRTLEDLLADEPQRFSTPQAVRIALQVLSVLEVAHTAGVVHRDIKPANLMLIANGRVKVTDFGIARVRGSKLAHTQAGVIMGTPYYAAPEQLLGQAFDCRVDLYAVGSVLYEMIVGRPPFEASSIYELIHAVHEMTPEPPSSLVAGIPAGVDQLLAKALAKRPEDRFASAAEMAAALQPFEAGAITKISGAGLASSVPPLPRAPVVLVEGTAPHDLVANIARRWPATVLGRQPTHTLIERALERPLHARAFCGALDAGGSYLLIADGILFAAFEPSTGSFGDAVIEAMPEEVDATLFAVPVGEDTRVVSLLASLLVPVSSHPAGLDVSMVDPAQLVRKLAAEGFDGALKLARGAELGFALFSRGQRVLDLFSKGWPISPVGRRWEEWIGESGATASVEPVRHAFPAITFRRQLRDLRLEVVRPEVGASSSVRSDTRTAARALELQPRAEELRRGESTLHALVVADPIHDAARWVLTELAPQFARFGRATRWKGLIEPIDRVREVWLHHAPMNGSESDRFDAVTYSADHEVLHVIERVALGTRAAVDGFLARTLSLKTARHHTQLGGAILIAPRFEEDALAGYLGALRAAKKRSVFSGLDALSHKEGFIRLSARNGLHVLLIEEADNERRPLVFE
ncbi:MAG: serine/threonine-protein kinase [Kofleriaceae bacterium]